MISLVLKDKQRDWILFSSTNETQIYRPTWRTRWTRATQSSNTENCRLQRTSKIAKEGTKIMDSCGIGGKKWIDPKLIMITFINISFYLSILTRMLLYFIFCTKHHKCLKFENRCSQKNLADDSEKSPNSNLSQSILFDPFSMFYLYSSRFYQKK